MPISSWQIQNLAFAQNTFPAMILRCIVLFVRRHSERCLLREPEKSPFLTSIDLRCIDVVAVPMRVKASRAGVSRVNVFLHLAAEYRFQLRGESSQWLPCLAERSDMKHRPVTEHSSHDLSVVSPVWITPAIDLVHYLLSWWGDTSTAQQPNPRKVESLRRENFTQRVPRKYRPKPCRISIRD